MTYSEGQGWRPLLAAAVIIGAGAFINLARVAPARPAAGPAQADR